MIIGTAKYKGTAVFIAVLNFRMGYAIISMTDTFSKGFKVDISELSNIKTQSENESNT